MQTNKKAVTMVIDGACSGNPGPGGWACLLRFGGHQREFIGFEHETTNNRMELEAAIRGFRALKEACRVTVIIAIRPARNDRVLVALEAERMVEKQSRPVLNHDLWEQLDAVAQPHEVTWKWAPGHMGHPDQERCDLLAKLHARKSRPA